MNIDSLEYRLLKKSVYTTLLTVLGHVETLQEQSLADYNDAESTYTVNTMDTVNTTTSSIYRAAADNNLRLWQRLKYSLDNIIDDIEGSQP